MKIVTLESTTKESTIRGNFTLDKIDVICEGGIQRGTHMLKALSVGAKACSGGRLYLYALASAGQKGVERALGLYKNELERDMKLMGCTNIKELNRANIKFR